MYARLFLKVEILEIDFFFLPSAWVHLPEHSRPTRVHFCLFSGAPVSEGQSPRPCEHRGPHVWSPSHALPPFPCQFRARKHTSIMRNDQERRKGNEIVFCWLLVSLDKKLLCLRKPFISCTVFSLSEKRGNELRQKIEFRSLAAS